VFVVQWRYGERPFVDRIDAVSDRLVDGGAVMAIAEWELEELPWPRPMLRVVEADDDGSWEATRGVVALPALRPLVPAEAEPQPVVRGAAMRRHRRAQVLRRRRAVAVAVVVIGVVAALALPLRALGASAPTPTSAGAAAGSVYVVQPGDTVWSIAQRLDGTGDPRALAASIVAETGSDVVVPGERIAVP